MTKRNLNVMRYDMVSVSENLDFQIGDVIILKNGYTATCQKVEKRSSIFLFDQLLGVRLRMGNPSTNLVYKTSDIRAYLKDLFLDNVAIFDDIRELMTPFKNGDFLRIPKGEEILGKWPLMKNRKSRIAVDVINQLNDSYWLQNDCLFAYQKCNEFAIIDRNGKLNSCPGEIELGVRIVFKIQLM